MRPKSGILEAVCGRVAGAGVGSTRCASLLVSIVVVAGAGCWAAPLRQGRAQEQEPARQRGLARLRLLVRERVRRRVRRGDSGVVLRRHMPSVVIGTVTLLLLALMRVASSFG